MLMGLSLGYIFNTLLPLRIGEVVRIAWVSSREKAPFTRVAASVAAERFSDVIAVSLIAMVITVCSGGRYDLSGLAYSLAAVAAALLVIALIVRRAVNARYALWKLFSVFNPAIRLGLVDFAWGFSELVTSRVLVRSRVLRMTVGMWCAYLLSYYVLSLAIESPFDATLQALLGSPLLPTWDGTKIILPADAMALMIFTGLPVIGVVTYGILNHWSGAVSALGSWMRKRETPTQAPGSTRQKFKSDGEFDTFLTSLFAGDRLVIRQFGLLGVDDAVIHKLFHGGSDAVTALVESGGYLKIRKFAAGDAGRKLKVQRQWLAANRDGVLPLVDVLAAREGDDFFQYDMPVVNRACDFYDTIHTSDRKASAQILETLLHRMAQFHEQKAAGNASPECIRAYLDQKTIRNAKAILRFVLGVFPHREYEINGVPYRIEDWKKLTDIEWLSSQVKGHRVSTIHGDLTIENIIAAPDHQENFYLIDPNPVNVFDSPLIDYAKLMQSLHLGYETLSRSRSTVVDGPCIRLPFIRSQQYCDLHSDLERFIVSHWGESVLREVYFHEIINYLRLMPYRIRQNPEQSGMALFAGTSYLLKRYVEAYPS
ncbi:hypothetical protein GCM10027034_12970 [Ramlibacter solisilvae]